jgi:hypothetical protein
MLTAHPVDAVELVKHSVDLSCSKVFGCDVRDRSARLVFHHCPRMLFAERRQAAGQFAGLDPKRPGVLAA